MQLQHNVTYREKDKGWQFIISYKDDNGKWKQKSKQGFKTKRVAKMECEKILVDLKLELTNKRVLNSSLTDLTFKEFADMYINHRKIYVTASSVENLKYTLKSFNYLDDLLLKDITNSDIQKGVDALHIRNLKYTTIKSRVAYLKSVFNSAIKEYKIINTSPMTDIVIKDNKEVVNRRALNNEEVIQLMDGLKETEFYLPALIALTSGLRIGEILGLMPSDIDIISNSISVNKQYKLVGENTSGIGPLKSKHSNRVIPVPVSTIKAITSYIEENGVSEDGRIFSVYNIHSYTRMINRGLKCTGIRVCMHELRHTYATNLISNGLDFKTAAYLLGHNIEMTMQTYSHVTSDMLDKASALIRNLSYSEGI